jgi:MSHA biogenesis protein MshJ
MSQWQLLNERYSQLQQREKIWLWAGSLLLTLWLVLIYLLEPKWQHISQADLQLQSMQRQQQDMLQQSEQLREQLAFDMDKDYRNRIALLQQQQQQLNEQIRQGASHFIGAEQMVRLLQNVLYSSKAVQVRSLHTAPPQPVRLQGQAEEEPALLFQHTLTLVMAGSFVQLQQVLQQIEQLPWLVNWAGLQYRVTDYPQAELTIELGTVSENEDFIRL